VANVVSDGILLYVSQASYQPGETPLACWIPARQTNNSVDETTLTTGAAQMSPLHVFERLIYRRCAASAAALNTGILSAATLL